jgi:hypothetical protein
MKLNQNGLVVYEGPSMINGEPIVGIITGLKDSSKNIKTGKMLQLFILHQNVHPVEAIRSGEDFAICGDCELRGPLEGGKGRACYVEVFKAPAMVWTCYKRGSGYPKWERHLLGDVEESAWLMGRQIRLGAYGDPCALPFELVKKLTYHADEWTGFTHQWRERGDRWKDLLMASVSTIEGYREAKAAGWRTFRITENSDLRFRHETVCMDEAYKTTCADCPLKCNGVRKGPHDSRANDVAVTAHGFGKTNYKE